MSYTHYNLKKGFLFVAIFAILFIILSTVSTHIADAAACSTKDSECPGGLVCRLSSGTCVPQLESGIPGVGLEGRQGAAVPTIPSYVNYLYIFVLSFVGIAGAISLVIWGTVWVGSAVVDKKAMAMEGIKNTLIGIGIALTAFILLYTINPDLTIIKMPGTDEGDKLAKNLLTAQQELLTTGSATKLNTTTTGVCRSSADCKISGPSGHLLRCAGFTIVGGGVWTGKCITGSDAGITIPSSGPCAGINSIRSFDERGAACIMNSSCRWISIDKSNQFCANN